MKQEIVWADPPRGRTKSSDIAQFAGKLRKKPGEWAVFPWSDELTPATIRSRSSDINRGRRTAPVAFREGFESKAEAGVLYVRYVGEQ